MAGSHIQNRTSPHLEPAAPRKIRNSEALGRTAWIEEAPGSHPRMDLAEPRMRPAEALVVEIAPLVAPPDISLVAGPAGPAGPAEPSAKLYLGEGGMSSEYRVPFWHLVMRAGVLTWQARFVHSFRSGSIGCRHRVLGFLH